MDRRQSPLVLARIDMSALYKNKMGNLISSLQPLFDIQDIEFLGMAMFQSPDPGEQVWKITQAAAQHPAEHSRAQQWLYWIRKPFIMLRQ